MSYFFLHLDFSPVFDFSVIISFSSKAATFGIKIGSLIYRLRLTVQTCKHKNVRWDQKCSDLLQLNLLPDTKMSLAKPKTKVGLEGRFKRVWQLIAIYGV